MAVAYCTPATDRPGWMEWHIGEADQFVANVLGTLLVRLDDNQTARVRLETRPMHGNVNGVIHGGTILALIDSAIFPATMMLTGNEELNVATIDLQTQFVSPGDVALPLDAVVTLTRETKRMTFTRGTLVQRDEIIATFTALQRKLGQ